MTDGYTPVYSGQDLAEMGIDTGGAFMNEFTTQAAVLATLIIALVVLVILVRFLGGIGGVMKAFTGFGKR